MSTQKESKTFSYTEQATKAIQQTERHEIPEQLKTLAKEALNGKIKWDTNLSNTINSAINIIDKALSKQVSVIIHHKKFRKLEGTWRGLHYLVSNTKTSDMLPIRVFNVSKRELVEDFMEAGRFDKSQVFMKIYEAEFGLADGEPYGAMIGDYEFSSSSDDVELLTNMSNIAAKGVFPFISAAAPKMFGFDSFTELYKLDGFSKLVETTEYDKWNKFRETENSRFVLLSVPRVLARLPYDSEKSVTAFNFEELKPSEDDDYHALESDFNCWMNAAFVIGTALTDMFENYGLSIFTYGVNYSRINGATLLKYPTQITIKEQQGAELAKLGFVAIRQCRNANDGIQLGNQTTKKAEVFDDPNETSDAAFSTRLPYIMLISRIAQTLVVMTRCKVASIKDAKEVERHSNQWIQRYVNNNQGVGAEEKAKYPLEKASIEIVQNSESSNEYDIVIHSIPWIANGRLFAPLKFVANMIPKPNWG